MADYITAGDADAASVGITGTDSDIENDDEGVGVLRSSSSPYMFLDELYKCDIGENVRTVGRVKYVYAARSLCEIENGKGSLAKILLDDRGDYTVIAGQIYGFEGQIVNVSSEGDNVLHALTTKLIRDIDLESYDHSMRITRNSIESGKKLTSKIEEDILTRLGCLADDLSVDHRKLRECVNHLLGIPKDNVEFGARGSADDQPRCDDVQAASSSGNLNMTVVHQRVLEQLLDEIL